MSQEKLKQFVKKKPSFYLYSGSSGFCTKNNSPSYFGHPSPDTALQYDYSYFLLPGLRYVPVKHPFPTQLLDLFCSIFIHHNLWLLFNKQKRTEESEIHHINCG